MDNQPCKTPVDELLRTVPEDFRIDWEDDNSWTNCPIGRLAHEAADEIGAWRARAAYDAEKIERLTDKLNAAEQNWSDEVQDLTAELGQLTEAAREALRWIDPHAPMHIETDLEAALTRDTDVDK